jgi:integrase
LRIAFTPPGSPCQVKRVIAPYTKANIKFAEMKLAEIKLDIMRGTFSWEKHFPNSIEARRERHGASEGATVREAMDRAMAWADWLKPATRRGYIGTVDAFVRFVGPGTPVAEIGRKEALSFRTHLLEGRKPSSTNTLLSHLRSLFSVLVDHEVLPSNPFLQLPRVTKHGAAHLDDGAQDLTEADVFTIEEANAIIAKAGELYGAHIADFITWQFWTGMRPGESAALRWADVNLETGRVKVKRTFTHKKGEVQTPKTKSSRREIILTDEAHRAVQRQAERSAGRTMVWMTLKGGDPDKADIIWPPTWKRILEKAGVEKARPFYYTRHSFASWALAAGEREAKVARHLGHASLAMLRSVYGHFLPDEEEKWTLSGPSQN